MILWYWIMNWIGYRRRRQPWPFVIEYLGICWEWLKKPQNSQVSSIKFWTEIQHQDLIYTGPNSYSFSQILSSLCQKNFFWGSPDYQYTENNFKNELRSIVQWCQQNSGCPASLIVTYWYSAVNNRSWYLHKSVR